MTDYYGTFWLPGERKMREVVGRLRLNDRAAPHIDMHEPPSAWMNHDPALPVLHAELAGMGGVTLLHLTHAGISIGPTYQASLRARFAISGVWVDHDADDAFLRRVQVFLPSLETLLPTKAYSYNFPKGRSRDRHRVTVHPGRFTWSHDDVTVEWDRMSFPRINLTDFALTTTTRLNLTSSRPRSVRYWVDTWIYPTLRLLPILTGRPADPSGVEMWMTKHARTAEQRHRVFRLFARGIGERDDGTNERDRPRPIATAADIDRNPDGLAGVLDRFAKFEADHPVALPLLQSSIYDPDRPLPNRYLELTAALEAFDSKRIGEVPIPDATFKATRTEVLARVKEAGASTDDTKFLKRWMPTRSHYSLEARLRRLHKAAPTGSAWTDVTYADMAEIRNQLAHGTEADDEKLRVAHDQALDVARHLVLCELGIGRF